MGRHRSSVALLIVLLVYCAALGSSTRLAGNTYSSSDLTDLALPANTLPSGRHAMHNALEQFAVAALRYDPDPDVRLSLNDTVLRGSGQVTLRLPPGLSAIGRAPAVSCVQAGTLQTPQASKSGRTLSWHIQRRAWCAFSCALQWFEVSWSGVRLPKADDFVALYAPADADLHKTAPVKYQWAARAEGHLESGQGTLK